MTKSVLVTGASSGIGLECARLFLDQGWNVVAQCRSQLQPVHDLVAEYGQNRVTPVQVDLGTNEGCVAAVAACTTLDAVVHSAGIWNAGAIRSLDPANLEQMFRVNTFSAYYLSREAVRVMEHGSLTFVGSTAGERGEPGHSHYAGSKAALWGLVQSLGQELAPEIRVNLVSPGWVRTPMAEPSLAEAGREDKITSAVPLRRIAEAEDVARAVYFLADETTARHLTGVDIPVSGGALLPLPRG